MAVVRKSWTRHASRGGVVQRSCSGPFNQSRRSHAEVVPCDRYTKYYKSHGAVCLFQSRRRHRVHGAPCDWGITGDWYRRISLLWPARWNAGTLPPVGTAYWWRCLLMIQFISAGTRVLNAARKFGMTC